MFDAVVTLRKRIVAADGKESVEDREVFCRIQSIGMNEFYQSYANGLKPEIRFILPDLDEWENEATVFYNGTEYSVLRSYVNGNELEITCESIIDGGY